MKKVSFPSKGVVRRSSLWAALDGRGPYPTPWAVNVRQEASLHSRMRGGNFTAAEAGSRSDPVYRDRAITFSSNAITAARQGDSTDTALSADVSDVGRPILFQLSEAGSVGNGVVGVAPHKDAYMICWTASETWVLSGDPATGSLRRVSDQVGIVGADAWCAAHDTIYFLSERGLYSVGADGGGLSPLSENTIPEHLIDVTDADCTLTYNHADRGVYFHSDSETQWYYDMERQAFWPFDDDTNNSNVLIGPIKIGAPGEYGRIMRMHGSTAVGSADVTWRLMVGDTAEEVADNGKDGIDDGDTSSNVHSWGTWEAGINHSAYPRARGQWALLWLASAGDWALERILWDVAPSGTWR